MKKLFSLSLMVYGFFGFSQMTDKVPNYIPFMINQKTGYMNQVGRTVIAPEYHIAMFFSEDCNLLNSPNPNVKLFGSAAYATVEKNEISYRINKKGKRVYEYKKEDLGKCNLPYDMPKYNAYVLNGLYGLISKENVERNIVTDFEISPQYQWLYVLDGDADDPMIIAIKNDKFGVINKKNKVMIPFIYEDIKPNLSWKTAQLFDVSDNGTDYFYIDVKNHAYKSLSIK